MAKGKSQVKGPSKGPSKGNWPNRTKLSDRILRSEGNGNREKICSKGKWPVDKGNEG